jgi:micrococcal nuclease
MYEYSGTVIRVIDGDTIEALIDLGFGVFKKMKLRIDGIDTPEIYRPSCEAEREHGKAATSRATELLMQQELIFHTAKKARMSLNRYVAKIYMVDSEDWFHTVMLQEGFAKKESYVT